MLDTELRSDPELQFRLSSSFFNRFGGLHMATRYLCFLEYYGARFKYA